jgi:hypothetical protein
MAGFDKKFKRKQRVSARKQFMKDFKSQMLSFKKQVKCTKCHRRPEKGEDIDQWHIDKESENIDLVCTDCFDQQIREPDAPLTSRHPHDDLAPMTGSEDV